MSTFNDNPERRVIPRWRDSRVTAGTGELDPLPARSARTVASPESFTKKLEEWREYRAVPYAADLVGAALVLDRQEEVREAAEFLLARGDTLSPAAQQLAHSALGIAGRAGSQLERDHELSVFTVINRLRARLKEQPRNALMWVDLARHYVTAGLSDKAAAAMQRGVALAPENRFALRSAARLHLHRDDQREALKVLRGSAATRHDPWLLAAEVAVASLGDQTSGLMKQARSLVASQQLSPWHLNELASALGTVALKEGNRKAARKLFTQALIAPSDNTVAQAEWATRRLSSLTLPPETLQMARGFEARAWEHYLAGAWGPSLQEARRWLEDEPFARRPAKMGTFVAAVLMEDYAQSIELARFGLKANPGAQILRNNLIFALASSSQMAKALEEATHVEVDKFETPAERVAWTATTGLLAFRLNLAERGRGLYLEAIEAAAQMPGTRAYAAAFLAREEILANTPRALSALEFAKDLATKTDAPPLRHLLQRLTSLLSDRAGR